MNCTLHHDTPGHPSSRLLIYFTGWGTTPEVVAHLARPVGWDYCACHDYTHLSPEELPDLSPYDEVVIVAWSMGVWAAEELAASFPPNTYGVAIAGTPIPMHDEYGIPDLIFRGTLEGLNDENRARFDRRMCGGKSLLALYQSFSARSTEDLRAELLSVYGQVKGMPIRPPKLRWRHAYVGSKDLIVPVHNQQRYWSEHGVSVHVLDGVGHYPFTLYSKWEQLL